MAAIIAAHGLRGFRTATPDAEFWFKPLDSSWLEPDRSEAQQFHQILAETLARDTRKQVAGVLRWLREGAEFGAQQAFGYGLIDYVSATAIVPPSG